MTLGSWALISALSLVGIGFAIHRWVAWAGQWGATEHERSMAMPGDIDPCTDGAGVVMTRAVTISAGPKAVWPWLAQLGRGAGWYSYDFLDNGARRSARHIVSWIPPPVLGDASAIGYLQQLDPGRVMTWCASGVRFLGSRARLVVDIRLSSQGESSRLIIRNSADAVGGVPRLALWIFQWIDGIMARRQLIAIKERAELDAESLTRAKGDETGARDQYQHYEVVYASGERAGTPGVEHAAVWRRAAIEAGLLSEVSAQGLPGG